MQRFSQSLIAVCFACIDFWYHVRREWINRRMAFRRDRALERIKALCELEFRYVHTQQTLAQHVFEQTMKRMQTCLEEERGR